MQEPPSQTALFTRLARDLWGESWHATAANIFGVPVETVAKWTIGQEPVPARNLILMQSMLQLRPPAGSRLGDDGGQACLDTLQPAIAELVQIAVGAGWDLVEVYATLLNASVPALARLVGPEAAANALDHARAQLRRSG